MKLYKLECQDQQGYKKEIGYYLDKRKAIKAKKEIDECPENKKYGIRQNIVEIETVDKNLPLFKQ